MTQIHPTTPADRDASPPAAPELPAASQRRFHFSLLQLMAYMFVAALLATGLHYLRRWVDAFPEIPWLSLPVLLVLSPIAGAILYLFVRAPFLIYHLGRVQSRLQQLQSHRSELKQWADDVRSRREAERHVSGGPTDV